MPLTIRPVTPAVGAEISGVNLSRLSDADFTQIEHAWNRHGALLFRDQQISDDDLLAFSRRFGDLDPPPVQEHGRQSPEGYPDVYVVSNVLDDKGAPIGALGAGEAVWHTDMSYLPTPPDASMLYSLEVPPSGGDTWVLGMQAAWTTLPDALKAKVRGRRIKHDGTYNSGGYLRKGVTPSDDPHTAPGAWHPAVLRHPVTGAPSLLSRAAAQLLRRGPRAGGVRRAARRAVGAYRAPRPALPASLARRRSAAVGQPLHDAPARPVRQRNAPRDASHADQGQGRAAGVGRGGIRYRREQAPRHAQQRAGVTIVYVIVTDFGKVESLFELSDRTRVPRSGCLFGVSLERAISLRRGRGHGRCGYRLVTEFQLCRFYILEIGPADRQCLRRSIGL